MVKTFLALRVCNVFFTTEVTELGGDLKKLRANCHLNFYALQVIIILKLK